MSSYSQPSLVRNLFWHAVLAVGQPLLGLIGELIGSSVVSPERVLEYSFVLGNLNLDHGRVLDVGCKGSMLPSILASLGVETYGIDVAPWKIPYPNFIYVRQDTRCTGFPDGFFDRITAVSVIEHIGLSGRFGSKEDPTGDKNALREMRRILKDNGRILLTVPYGRPKVMRPWCRVYGRETLLEILDGLKIEKVELYVRDEDKHWRSVSEEMAGQVEPDPMNYAVALLMLSKEKSGRSA